MVFTRELWVGQPNEKLADYVKKMPRKRNWLDWTWDTHTHTHTLAKLKLHSLFLKMKLKLFGGGVDLGGVRGVMKVNMILKNSLCK